MGADKRIARIPKPEQVGGVEWLILEYDAKSGGWFLYFHRTLEEPSEADNWYLSADEALNQAETWGVNRGDWRDA